MGLLELVENGPQNGQNTPTALAVASPARGRTPLDEILTGIRQGWPEGHRNNGLLSIGGHLRARGLSTEVIGALLESVNKSTGMNLAAHEVTAIARSLSRYEKNGRELLPPIEDSRDLFANPPPLQPVLIDGILRKTHKMLLSGPSKAGKSFSLINLALSLAHGTDWLGFACRQCNVLYINLEIDRGSCWERFCKVAEARRLDPGTERLKLWNLRGRNPPLEDFIPALIEGIGRDKYEAVIIDPLYKMFNSEHTKFDENATGSLTMLFNGFDQVINSCGCSTIAAGHFTKGMAGGKSPIDRTSGSGVLGRDPDAILTMTELADTDDGYRLESVLREFPSTVDLSLRWIYPLHKIDTTLDSKALKGSAGRSQAVTGLELLEAFEWLDKGEGVTVQAMRDHLGAGSINTFKERIKELDAKGQNRLGLQIKGNLIISTINNPKES
jgi:hypothetical protein